jgi:UPF0716 protein FxsA
MGGLLLLVFIIVPILEIIVFIQAGELIGLWPTVAAIILTALIGAAIVRHQGLSTLARAQESLAAGRFPITEVFDGLCLVFAGAFLITPGFLTDSAGFLLLVPPVRALLRRIVGSRMIASGQVKVWADSPPRDHPPGRKRDGIVIDAEYEHVPDQPEKPRAPGEEGRESQVPDSKRALDRDPESAWGKRTGRKKNGGGGERTVDDP